MTENSSVRTNASGTYSDYFQISDTGAKIYQGSSNPNNISVTPSPSLGDMFICTSIPELFLYNGTIWIAVGEASGVPFYTQNITTSGFVIGTGISFSGVLYASANISTVATLTLPTPVTAGTTIILKDESGAAHTNTITISSEDSSTIDGQDSIVLDINYGCYTFLYTGSNWTIISAISSFPLNELSLGGGIAEGYTLPSISPVITYINNYENNQFIPGTYSNGMVLAVINVVDNLEFPMNFVGSYSTAQTAPTSDSIINITVNNTYVGTLTFEANQTVGSFVTSSTVVANPGDVIKFTTATVDGNLAGVAFTIEGSALYTPIVFADFISITTSLSNYYINESIAIQGSAFPANSNVQVGFSTTNNVPPGTFSTTTAVMGFWNIDFSIPTAGAYYVWAQIENTNINTTHSVTISSPTLTITNSVDANYYASFPFPITGYLAPAETDVALTIGYSTSNSVPPGSTSSLTSDSLGMFSTSLSIPSVGTYYVWVQESSGSLNAILTVNSQGPSISISNPSDGTYYTGVINFSGMIAPPSDQAIEVGFSSSGTIQPSHWVTTTANAGAWNANLTIDGAASYYIWAQQISNPSISTDIPITVNSPSEPVAIVQSTMAVTTGDSSITLTDAPTASNWLVVLAAMWNNDLPGEGWTAANDSFDNSVNDFVGVFYRQVQEGDPIGPYIPLAAGNGGTVMVIYELANIGSSFTFDQVDGQVDINSNEGTLTVGSGVVSTVANSIELGLIIAQQGAPSIPMFEGSWTSDGTIAPTAGGNDGTVAAMAAHRTLSSLGASLDASVYYDTIETAGLAYIAINIPSI